MAFYHLISYINDNYYEWMNTKAAVLFQKVFLVLLDTLLFCHYRNASSEAFFFSIIYLLIFFLFFLFSRLWSMWNKGYIWPLEADLGFLLNSNTRTKTQTAMWVWFIATVHLQRRKLCKNCFNFLAYNGLLYKERIFSLRRNLFV